MKKLLFSCCFILVITSCRDGQNHFSRQTLGIEYVELINTDLDDLTPIRIECESLRTFPNIDRDTIFNREAISQLETQLSILTNAEIHTVLDEIDARVIMVVHAVDGDETEYCIGNGAIRIRGRVYMLPKRIELWLRAHIE